jgi:hypothetical protein
MRIAIAVALAGAFAIFAFAIADGVSGSVLLSFVAGAIVAAGVGWQVWRRPILPITETSRALHAVSALAAIVALVQLGMLTVFMVDSTRVAYSTVPESAWEVRHSCLSAYFVAGEAMARGEDIFATSLYNDPSDTGVGQRRSRKIGPFYVDVYEYPPPFLIVPRACRLLTADFHRLRPLWFGLCGGAVLIAMLAVARGMGPEAGTRALLLLPLAWVGHGMLNTLQKGNVQVVVVALALLAMVLFERRRWAGGALLLAYAIVSKLHPGMLVFYLLVRRQWRPVAWTAAMGVVLVAISLWDGGLTPFIAFLDHLPKLLSGEAFPALRNPGPVSINTSVPGLVFKAKLFGVPGMGFPAAKIVGWIFTAVILWATYSAARRTLREDEKPLVWIAILILATLRSPFLPQAYGVVPSLWALTLLGATYPATARTIVLVVLAAVSLNLHWALDAGMDHRVRAALSTLLPQAATILVAVLALRRRTGPEPSTL